MAYSLARRQLFAKTSFRWLSNYETREPDFGILFDIDGVIVRGKKVLPFSPKAFTLLVDDQGKFRIPTVFVTNAGNSTRLSKAQQLSGWLGVEIFESQVVMAHSPLRMFHDYHQKHVLVVGQGPIAEIAHNNGFNNVTTMKQLRHSFPSLDAVDHKRRRAPPCSFEEYFPRLDAIVLFGEPIRWETSLQLIIDVLLTNGKPSMAPESVPVPHIPLLACNMDLQWMAEAVMPRFGHGAFLLCLENLYKKITGQDLIYTALIGKPSEITYVYAEQVLQAEAARIGIKTPVKSVYCVGDNINTDIFGANLYNKYLQMRKSSSSQDSLRHNALLQSSSHSGRCIVGAEIDDVVGAERCLSVLVETGVYSPDDKTDQQVVRNHSPRDFLPVESCHQAPNFIVKNVLEAVQLIFRQQNYYKKVA